MLNYCQKKNLLVQMVFRNRNKLSFDSNKQFSFRILCANQRITNNWNYSCDNQSGWLLSLHQRSEYETDITKKKRFSANRWIHIIYCLLSLFGDLFILFLVLSFHQSLQKVYSSSQCFARTLVRLLTYSSSIIYLILNALAQANTLKANDSRWARV